MAFVNVTGLSTDDSQHVPVGLGEQMLIVNFVAEHVVVLEPVGIIDLVSGQIQALQNAIDREPEMMSMLVILERRGLGSASEFDDRMADVTIAIVPTVR